VIYTIFSALTRFACYHSQEVILHKLTLLCFPLTLRTVKHKNHKTISQIAALGTGKTTIMHCRWTVDKVCLYTRVCKIPYNVVWCLPRYIWWYVQKYKLITFYGTLHSIHKSLYYFIYLWSEKQCSLTGNSLMFSSAPLRLFEPIKLTPDSVI
jgi:hypothetical protein